MEPVLAALDAALHGPPAKTVQACTAAELFYGAASELNASSSPGWASDLATLREGMRNGLARLSLATKWLEERGREAQDMAGSTAPATPEERVIHADTCCRLAHGSVLLAQALAQACRPTLPTGTVCALTGAAMSAIVSGRRSLEECAAIVETDDAAASGSSGRGSSSSGPDRPSLRGYLELDGMAAHCVGFSASAMVAVLEFVSDQLQPSQHHALRYNADHFMAWLGAGTRVLLGLGRMRGGARPRALAIHAALCSKFMGPPELQAPYPLQPVREALGRSPEVQESLVCLLLEFSLPSAGRGAGLLPASSSSSGSGSSSRSTTAAGAGDSDSQGQVRPLSVPDCWQFKSHVIMAVSHPRLQHALQAYIRGPQGLGYVRLVTQLLAALPPACPHGVGEELYLGSFEGLADMLCRAAPVFDACRGCQAHAGGPQAPPRRAREEVQEANWLVLPLVPLAVTCVQREAAPLSAAAAAEAAEAAAAACASGTGQQLQAGPTDGASSSSATTAVQPALVVMAAVAVRTASAAQAARAKELAAAQRAAHCMCDSWSESLHMCAHIEGASSCARVAEWAGAAGAGLALLPLLCQLAQRPLTDEIRQGAMLGMFSATPAADLAASLISVWSYAGPKVLQYANTQARLLSTRRLQSMLGRASAGLPGSSAAAGQQPALTASPSELGSLAAPLFRLHDTSCRIVHWSLSLPPGQLSSLPSLNWPRLLLGTGAVLESLQILLLADSEEPEGGSLYEPATDLPPAEAKRLLTAASAAHVEMLVAASTCLPPAELEACLSHSLDLVDQLAGAMGRLPCISAEAAAALHRILGLAAQRRPNSGPSAQRQAMAAMASLKILAGSPPSAVALISSQSVPLLQQAFDRGMRGWTPDARNLGEAHRRRCMEWEFGRELQACLSQIVLWAESHAAKKAANSAREEEPTAAAGATAGSSAAGSSRGSMASSSGGASSSAGAGALEAGASRADAEGGSLAAARKLLGAARQLTEQLDALEAGFRDELCRSTNVPATTAQQARRMLPLAAQAAAILQQLWQLPEEVEAARLAAAHAAAPRPCAHLRCPNLGATASKRCSGCRSVIRYCGTSCSHADWKSGHRRACKLLAAEKAAQQAQQRAAAVVQQG